MKTVTINEITYTQVEEKDAGMCHNCVANVRGEECDNLCKKLSLASGNDCQDAIWKEVNP